MHKSHGAHGTKSCFWVNMKSDLKARSCGIFLNNEHKIGFNDENDIIHNFFNKSHLLRLQLFFVTKVLRQDKKCPPDNLLTSVHVVQAPVNSSWSICMVVITLSASMGPLIRCDRTYGCLYNYNIPRWQRQQNDMVPHIVFIFTISGTLTNTLVFLTLYFQRKCFIVKSMIKCRIDLITFILLDWFSHRSNCVITVLFVFL